MWSRSDSRPTRPRALVALAVVLCLGAAPAAAATDGRADRSAATVHDGAARPRPGPARFPEPLDWTTGRGAQTAYDPSTEFIGIDGQVHAISRLAIPGRDGYFYIGADFDLACAFGSRARRSMRALAAVARIIERSGRRAVFTVAPNKAAAVEKRLPGDVPQGACGRRGLAIQNEVLDTFDSRFYLPLRRPLLSTEHAYWRTDTHWSTVGTSVLALRLAKMLDPQLADKQRFRETERTHTGDLAVLTDYVPGPETAPARVPDNGVRTRAAGGSPEFDPTFAEIHTDLSWTSRPAQRTYPGRTLLLGDSFTYVGLEALQNLFRRGRFIWTGTTSDREVFKAIRRADTVVLSVVQRYVTYTPLESRQFRVGLREALLDGR